jgi:hypothetical protein
MPTYHFLTGRIALVTGGASGLGRGADEAAWLDLESSSNANKAAFSALRGFRESTSRYMLARSLAPG